MKQSKFKPILACDYDPAKAKFPLLGLPKLDGVRALVTDKGLLGRSLKPFKNTALLALFSQPELVGLEGELVVGTPTAEDACRKTTSLVNTINGGVDDLLLYVFDDHTHPSVSYAERYYNAHKRVHELTGALKNIVRIVPATIVETAEQAEVMYQGLLTQGFEGIILRDPAGKYKYGKATTNENTYLRIKPSEDSEAIVLSLEEAEANNNEAVINELGLTERSSHQENKTGKGMVGALICKCLVTGNTIKVGAGKLNHDERKLYWEQPDRIVGKTIKFRHLTTGVKDAPRHARFVGMGDFITERAEEDMS